MIRHEGLLETGRWFKLSIAEQLANVGCDVGRAINWKNKGDQEYSMGAVFRALELIDFTVLDPKNRGGRLKEILRIREFLVDYFVCENKYGSTDEWLEKYFMYFCWSAAIERENKRKSVNK